MPFFRLALCLLLTAVLGACAAKPPLPPGPPGPQATEEEELTEEIRELLGEHDGDFVVEQCVKADNAVRRDECYRQGGALKAVTANEPPRRGTVKTVRQTKAAKGKKSGKTRKIVLKGRCQPQCLIYARCRSGFMSCRLGNTNPLRWWPCAEKKGATSQIPVPGSVLLLDRQKDQRMRVGHAVYVEEVCRLKNGEYLLRVSHSNYNRMCGLDLDAKVLYNAKARSAAFITGAWAKWAKNLRTLGFVTK
jgi:hypothetical protein